MTCLSYSKLTKMQNNTILKQCELLNELFFLILFLKKKTLYYKFKAMLFCRRAKQSSTKMYLL